VQETVPVDQQENTGVKEQDLAANTTAEQENNVNQLTGMTIFQGTNGSLLKVLIAALVVLGVLGGIFVLRARKHKIIEE